MTDIIAIHRRSSGRTRLSQRAFKRFGGSAHVEGDARSGRVAIGRGCFVGFLKPFSLACPLPAETRAEASKPPESRAGRAYRPGGGRACPEPPGLKASAPDCFQVSNTRFQGRHASEKEVCRRLFAVFRPRIVRKPEPTMIMRPVILPLLLSLGLVACKPAGDADQNGNNSANASAAMVELPPAIRDSASYRCTDNSLAYVDFLADDRTIHLRIDSKDGPITRLTAPEAGKPFVGEGYEVAGDHTRITLKKPNSALETCKA